MACKCAERRQQLGLALAAARKGDTATARAQLAAAGASLRDDARVAATRVMRAAPQMMRRTPDR